MHAYLIVGDGTSAKSEIEKLTLDRNAIPLEFSIDKIEKTRELGSFLKLSQPPGTTIIIKDIDSATIDSLNAFLKNLEEPNPNITFVLTARNEFRVIPTILSRCQIIRVQKNEESLEDKDYQDSKKFINGTVGQKLQTIDTCKKREEAIFFLQNLMYSLQKDLEGKAPEFPKIAFYLKIVQQTLDALNQNGNVTMQLTNMVVGLEKYTGLEKSKKV